jgi:hypothetical protein
MPVYKEVQVLKNTSKDTSKETQVIKDNTSIQKA